MNLYLIVLLLLVAGAVLEWFKPKYQQKIFTVCWCVTTAVVALRFGQGTDYATYEGIYRTIPAVIDPKAISVDSIRRWAGGCSAPFSNCSRRRSGQ